MEVHLQEYMLIQRNKEEGNISGQTTINILVTGLITKLMEMVSTFGMMVESIQDNGKII
jgi:hypothetical protein